MKDSGGSRGYLIGRAETLNTHLRKCPLQSRETREAAVQEYKNTQTRKAYRSALKVYTGDSSPSPSPVSTPSATPPSHSPIYQAGPSSSALPRMLNVSTSQPAHSFPLRLHTRSVSLTSLPTSIDASPPPFHDDAGFTVDRPYVLPGPSAVVYGPRPPPIDLSDPPRALANHYPPTHPSAIPPPIQSALSHAILTGGIPWSDARQRRFESLVARLTASANFSLSWVENPVFHTICDEFIPGAKPPTRKVLTKRLLPSEVEHYRNLTIKVTSGAEVTVQADGWTGINNHHLLAYMMTAQRQVCDLMNL